MSTETKLLKTTGLVSCMTFLSRILGFLRDMLAAHYFGASGDYDAFLVAFKIPNFMRRLFAEGAFSQAFIPTLSQYQSDHSVEQMQGFIAKVQGCMLTVLIPLSLLGILSSKAWVLLFAPGFDAVQIAETSLLLKITFPYILLISMTAIGSGILNAQNKYLVPALTPIFLNLAMIVSLILPLPQSIRGLAWGVLGGGILQLIFQYPFLKRIKLLVWPQWGWQDSRVQRILKLMLPVILGVSVNQINLIIDTLFASYLENGAISWLYYADRLMELPLGLFGVGIATVVLPHLSRTQDQYSRILDWALKLVIFLGLPCALALALWAKPLMATLFMSGRFQAQDVQAASWALIAYSPGILGLMLVKVLASAFYAKKDTKTPVKIAVLIMLLHAVLNALFFRPFGHLGLCLSTSLSALLNAALLFFVLCRRSWYIQPTGWLKFSAQLSAGLLSIIVVWLLANPSSSTWLESDPYTRWGWLLGLVAASILSFGAALWFSGLRVKDFQCE